jgi:hypothetical protein
MKAKWLPLIAKSAVYSGQVDRPMRLLAQQGNERVAYQLLVIHYEDFGRSWHIASGKAWPEGGMEAPTMPCY